MIKHRVQHGCPAGRPRARSTRRAAAMMTALFVMVVTSVIVIGILDTEKANYAALHNTIDYDRARYLAEAGLSHALAKLEEDITWRTGIGTTEFPVGSGNVYSATAADTADARILVTAIGTAGSVTRKLTAIVKHGG